MIITLTTDFGLTDPFVGIMKGVILGIAPDARIVDITHEIPSYNVCEASFIIDCTYRYFPAGTIHVIVVDPGVGSSRRPVAAAVDGHFFVAPDNGVLSWVMHSSAKSAEAQTYHITNVRLFNPVVSSTFHGRDIFAPVAAHLARGVSLDSVGPRISDCWKDAPPELQPLGPHRFAAAVLRIDRFGNIVTNIRKRDLGPPFLIRVAGTEIRRLLSNYAAADAGEFFAIEGSAGFVELSLNQGSAADRFGVRRGSEIEVETGETNQ